MEMGEIAMRRMVVVSNRVSLPEKKTEQAGGLATAVAPLLQAEGGLWFGWSGKVHEEAEDQPLGLTQAGRVRYATFDLSPAEFEGYYNNYANGVLWPLLHGMPEIMKFARADLALFEAVNARFADLLEPVLAPDDLIWVHDYHLFLLPRELRERGVENPLGFFLHIPFPAPDLFALLPNGADLIEAVLAADLIGRYSTITSLLHHHYYHHLTNVSALHHHDDLTARSAHGRTQATGYTIEAHLSALHLRAVRAVGASAPIDRADLVAAVFLGSLDLRQVE
jgi:trehalose-6-phosphate synthase